MTRFAPGRRRQARFAAVAASLPRAALAGVATVGATRLYGQAFRAVVRHRVRRIEDDTHVAYDPILGFCEAGRPVLLTAPGNDTTVVFFDGLRIRPAASMHRAWFEKLHSELGVNIVAPVLGRQSMAFDQRNRDWNFHDEMRSAVQILSAYKAGHPPGHRIVAVGFSWGAVNAYAVAARCQPDALVLISPLPHSCVLSDNAVRSTRLAARAAFWVAKQISMGRGRHMLATLVPFYMRISVSGGWDIADRECRKRNNREILNGQEIRMFDVFEAVDAMTHCHEHVIPKIVGTDVTVVWGERDSLLGAEVFKDLTALLASQGNVMTTAELTGSGHDVLLDAKSAVAQQAVVDAVSRVRTSGLANDFHRS